MNLKCKEDSFDSYTCGAAKVHLHKSYEKFCQRHCTQGSMMLDLAHTGSQICTWPNRVLLRRTAD